jgi:hypothetical protein
VYNIEGLSPHSQRYSQSFEHVLLHPDQLVEIGLLLRPRHVGWMAHLFKPHWIVFFLQWQSYIAWANYPVHKLGLNGDCGLYV